MKNLIQLLILTLTISTINAQSNKCDDRQCFSQDLLNKSINTNNWNPTCGTPTFNNSNNSVWVWSYGNRGESIQTGFNFQANKTYCISLEYRLTVIRQNAIDPLATFNVLGVNNLVPCGLVPGYPNYNATTLPILSDRYVNNLSDVNSGSFVNHQILITPNINFSDILIIPKNADNGTNGINANQVNFEVRNIQIKEVISCPCEIKGSIKFKHQGDCSYRFTASVAAGSNTKITGYLWDFGDGNTSIDQNPTHYYASTGSYIVTLTVYGITKDGQCCTKTFKTKVFVEKECPQNCEVKSNFKIKKFGWFWSRYCNLMNTSTSNSFTTIVGYEWYIDGVLVSTQKDFNNYRGRGKIACLRVYGINKQEECCFDEYCQKLQ